MTNILTWCDEKVSYLKSKGVQFSSGVAVIPEQALYCDVPTMISTFKYRKDIPESLKKDSLISYFMSEDCLWARLTKLDEEIATISQYGGIVGFDLSPSVGMLRPRQELSIFINSLYNAYCAVNGVKVLPNSRLGDLATMSMSASIPYGSNFVSSKLGCCNYGFKNYGLYQTKLLLEKINPQILFIYGSIRLSDAKKLLNSVCPVVITYPDRRNRVRNHEICYCYTKCGVKVIKQPLSEYKMGGVA